MAMLIRADGTTDEILPGKKLSLEQMQKLVGGYIQVCATADGRRMVVDEDGKVKGKPFNLLATQLYVYGTQVPIVGDVVVGTRKELGV